MYRRILVPLDGSEESECALAHAKAIALCCKDCELILLFVVEHVSAGLYQTSAEGQERLTAWGKDNLARIESSLRSDGVSATTAIVEGKPAEAIVEYVAHNKIDLIVMTTHGRSGPSRWAFGSVADRVLRTSPVPVLIAVPRGCRIS